MKKIMLSLFLMAVVGVYESKAQVEVDKIISLTGSGTDAKVTGIKSVTDRQDGVNVDVIQKNSLVFAIATGSTNAYVVALSPAVTGSFPSGTIVHFIANNPNTGAATLKINGVDNIPIKKNYNADLANNDIKAGQAVSVMYDGTNFQMLSQLGNASPTPIRCKATQNSSSGFGGPGLSTISFDAEQFDEDVMHNNATNNSRITFKTAGYWLVGGSVKPTAQSTGPVGCVIQLNGSSIIAAGGGLPYNAGGSVTCFRYFNVNDYIELLANCPSTGTNTSGDEATNFWAMKY